MTKKFLVKGATAMAAALAVTPASAAEAVQCVPIYHGETVSISTLCDASKVNKEHKLKLASHGCAIQQDVETAQGYGFVESQASYTAWEGRPQLRDCEVEEVISFMQEL